ncbi:TRAP transporter large permease [Sulfitobacter sp.]|uniref:TRAP transporter large permease n=1 Tax=Sulfitobacter sp. TaxID=1903071 RepID=UPI00329A49D7
MDNSQIAGIVISLMVIHLVIGLPLFVVLAVGSLSLIGLTGAYSLSSLSTTLFASLDSWALLAMPLFILAGEVISRGRIARDLINLGEALVGWLRGGLGMATIFGCFFFAGTSGSSSADTATIGKIMVPALKRKGYDPSYAASLAASGGILGVIVPPSLIFIIYGIATATSVGDLFVAGILPGFMIAFGLCVANYLVCRFGIWGASERTAFSGATALKALWQARYGFGAPVVILGGIYGGFFTPTEAAAVAVGYVFLVELFLAREIKFSEIGDIFTAASRTTGILAPIIAFSILFAEVLAILRVPSTIVEVFTSFEVSFVVSVALIVLMLLVIGCLLEPIAAILVIMPILYPIGQQLGFDPVHFGVFVVSTLSVGFITPPVGINLFAASAVSGEPFMRIAVRAIPAFVALILICFAIAFMPSTILWFR